MLAPLPPQPQEADALLEAFSASPPAGCSALHPALMRVQLALEAGGGAGQQRALQLLSSLPAGAAEEEGVAQSAAVLASRLALHQQVGRQAADSGV